MSTEITKSIGAKDKQILRDLAKQVAEIAAQPVQKERIKNWTALNSLKPNRPMVFADPQNGWGELTPTNPCQCEHPSVSHWEWNLRASLIRNQLIKDDAPIMNILDVNWDIKITGFGLAETQHRTGFEGGSYRWEAPIKTADDMKKLTFQEFDVDRESTEATYCLAQEIFGDILNVRKVGVNFFRFGLTRVLIHLRGLDQMMIDMYEEPELLHDLMAFLRDNHTHFMDFCERENVLSLNNGPEMINGSGGNAVNTDLPASDFNGTVRLKDMFCWGESQETVGVGPKQFDEFVLAYQLPLMKRFGLVDYGCCEPVDNKIDLIIAKVPQLRWVSVSPWANREMLAQKIGNKFVYVYKPNPSRICSPTPDWKAAEEEVRETLRIAKGCNVSLIMKDTSTFHHQPDRITRWSDMARRICEESV